MYIHFTTYADNIKSNFKDLNVLLSILPGLMKCLCSENIPVFSNNFLVFT